MAKEQSNRLSGKRLEDSRFTRLDDGTIWPSHDQGDLEWQLRNGSELSVLANRMPLASIVEAYIELLYLPQKRRNEICRAIREADR